MTETKVADLIGLGEIADLYGISKNVASGWTRKHDFPRPAKTFRMGPVWDQNDVLAWKPVVPVREYRPTCIHCGFDGWQDLNFTGELGPEVRITLRCGRCDHTTEIDYVRVDHPSNRGYVVRTHPQKEEE